MPNEELVELVAVSGFDFVLIDCEHGAADVLALRQHLAAAAAGGLTAWVRTGADEPALVLRALDAGAGGIVAPHIDSADDARRLVDSAYYPPLGHRGFAGYSRPGGFGTVPADEHRQRQLAETVVFGMIESPSAVTAASEILAVPGIDGTMIGVADLAVARTEGDPPQSELIAAVHDAVRAAGSIRMDIVPGPEQARAAFASGAQVVVYNLTHALMQHLAVLRDVS